MIDDVRRHARLLHLDDAVRARGAVHAASCRSRGTRGSPSIYGVAGLGRHRARRRRCPAGQRPGLLTRALFLSTGSANTRPIMKGVFIRKNILCDDIPPPPPGANAKPPELGPEHDDARERRGDHRDAGHDLRRLPRARSINPLGFATEGFDALGRFRTRAAPVRRRPATRSGTKPVDTTTVPQVLCGDDDAVADAGRPDVADRSRAARSRPAWRATSSASPTARWEDSRRRRLRARGRAQGAARAAARITDLAGRGADVGRVPATDVRVEDEATWQASHRHLAAAGAGRARRRDAGAAGAAVAARRTRVRAPTRCSRARRASSGSRPSTAARSRRACSRARRC